MNRAFEVNHLPNASVPRGWTLEQAISLLPPREARPRSTAVYEHGSLMLKLFAPVGADTQQPHAQDEMYFVARGQGWFMNGETRHAVAPGDALFVPAGVVHRFEDFSEDFAVWVVFYGPQGGEKA